MTALLDVTCENDFVVLLHMCFSQYDKVVEFMQNVAAQSLPVDDGS